MISLIAAMTKNRVIGRNQRIPWYLPADLMHFKKLTLGKPVIMGRRTFDSIGGPLSGRHNVIITRQSLSIANCEVFHSLQSALKALEGQKEIIVIGGAMLYEEALPLVHRLYLTIIDQVIEGDTYFPVWNQADWKIISEKACLSDKKNIYNYSFLVLERIKN